MILLLIDALIFSSVLIATILTIRNGFRKHNEKKLELALVRQKSAEKLAKEVDQLNVKTLNANEKKIQDKLNGLH